MTLVVEGVRTVLTESGIITEVYPASGGTLYRQLYLTGYWTIQAPCQVRLELLDEERTDEQCQPAKRGCYGQSHTHTV